LPQAVSVTAAITSGPCARLERQAAICPVDRAKILKIPA
jgi:hypothetical protein